VGASGRSQLILPLRNRAQFLEQSFDQDDSGGLFVPGDLDVELGDEVDLEIAFVEEQVRFHIRAVVRWKRASAGRRALPGVGLGFLPSEATTKGQLLRFARGDDVDHVEREARRYALHLEVKLAVDGAPARVVTTDDMSEGGCFLLVDPPLPLGTTVQITLRAPGALFSWLTLPGRVAWRRSQGHAQRSGIGVEFRFADERQRRRMAKLLVLLRERVGRELRVLPPRVPTSTAPTMAAPATTAPATTAQATSATPLRSSMLPRK
jgi:Tfp pilus assembly protein PilZ